MDFPDDYAVTSGDRIFHHTQNAVGACFAAVHHRIQESAKALTDDDALALNPEEWAHEIAAEFSVTAPTVDAGNHSFEQEGRIEVNCTGWPGISFSMTEMGGPVIRAGHRFRVTMPGTGALTLLKSRLPRGGSGYKVDIHSTGITRVYEWPRVLPATQLQADVDKFLANFTAGADELSEQIARQNGMLADVASKALANRQTEIRESRAYLGDLRLKVTRDPAADTLIPALPMRNPGPGAVAQTRTRQPGTTEARDATAAPARLDQPTLDQFYDHVVTVLGAVMVGFERSPRRFAKAAEETLRDFMLVTLNSHYQGAATGETFNGGGSDCRVRWAAPRRAARAALARHRLEWIRANNQPRAFRRSRGRHQVRAGSARADGRPSCRRTGPALSAR